MHKIDSNMLLKYHHVVSLLLIFFMISAVFYFNWLRGRGLGKSGGGGRNNFVLYSPINYN
jgi:hypothetical protein